MRVAAAVFKIKGEKNNKNMRYSAELCAVRRFLRFTKFQKMGFKNVSFHADITIFRISVHRAEICAALKIHLIFESYESCVDFFTYLYVRCRHPM